MALEKNKKPDSIIAQEKGSSGIPLQQRIDALREARKETSSETQAASEKKASELDEMMESLRTQKDEAFLEKFEGVVFKRLGMRNGENPETPAYEEKDPFVRRNGGIHHSSEQRVEPSSPAASQNGDSKAGQTPSKETQLRKGLPPRGAILQMGTGEVAIFHHDVPSKNYQVVLVLNPDGSLSPEGVCLLEAYDFERIGLIPHDHLEQLLHSLVWNRDHIVFHLDSFDHAHLIVRPRAGMAAPPETYRPTRPAEWPAPPRSVEIPGPKIARFGKEAVIEKIERGRRFRISFSKDRVWEAVYWCEDMQGTVIAHKTQGIWSLMHLDLSRFKDAIQFLDKVSEAEEIEIEKALLHIWA